MTYLDMIKMAAREHKQRVFNVAQAHNWIALEGVETSEQVVRQVISNGTKDGAIRRVERGRYTFERDDRAQAPSKAYAELLERILVHGERRDDRTGVGTLSVFGHQFTVPADPLPVIGQKKVAIKNTARELLWFLSGSTNVNDLPDSTQPWWKPWADENGELGPVYGSQWASWRGPDGEHVNQIERVVESLRSDPMSRRHVVSAWNAAEIPKMALAPCHTLFQFYVDAERVLHCQLYQRSADVFLGLPVNMVSYALLTQMIAQQAGLNGAGTLTISLGDAHLYTNHLDQAKEALRRTPDDEEMAREKAQGRVRLDVVGGVPETINDYHVHDPASPRKQSGGLHLVYTDTPPDPIKAPLAV